MSLSPCFLCFLVEPTCKNLSILTFRPFTPSPLTFKSSGSTNLPFYLIFALSLPIGRESGLSWTSLRSIPTRGFNVVYSDLIFFERFEPPSICLLDVLVSFHFSLSFMTFHNSTNLKAFFFFWYTIRVFFFKITSLLYLLVIDDSCC